VIGQPETRIRHAYDIIGKNKDDHTHFQIRMPEVSGARDRWVAAGCGVHVTVATAAVDRAAPVRDDPPTGEDLEDVTAGESTTNLLAASWQPAFCESKPSKDECEALNAGNLPHAEGRFSIHGLWPQPRGNDYCGVPRRVKNLDKPSTWHLLPAPGTDAETTAALAVAMPGVASHLHHHEWIKHGTCYGGDGGADEYYDDTLALMAALEASPVGQLFAENVGNELDAGAIRAAFDAGFGAGAGDRVKIDCLRDRDSGRTLIVELKINLQGEIDVVDGAVDMGPLILAADPVGDPGCSGGIVDPGGDQR
ncbi:MAG: ribonuclease T, partial [Pseudomonadota bacterium]